MKIVHIHTSMMTIGGIEAMVCALANEMSNHSHDVTVCSIFEPKEDAIFWNRLDRKVTKVTLGKKKPGFSITEIFKIYQFIKSGNYDIVNIHGFMYYYVFAVLLLHRKIKFFYTVHSEASKESAAWDKRIMLLKRFCFKHDWIKPITISPTSCKSFQNFYNLSSIYIYNGIKKPIVSTKKNLIDEVRLTPNTKVFLHPCRISLAKNQLVLCKAFDKIIQEGYDVVLIIAGSNDDQEIFKQLKPYFGNRIKYIGVQSDIPWLMAKADAFCLPSIWEGMPVALLEALSVGCIPICTPVGGIIDVIKNGVNGFLSKSPEENDYYQALMSYLSKSDEELKIIQRNCTTSFIPFEIQETAKSYLEYYQSNHK